MTEHKGENIVINIKKVGEYINIINGDKYFIYDVPGDGNCLLYSIHADRNLLIKKAIKNDNFTLSINNTVTQLRTQYVDIHTYDSMKDWLLTVYMPTCELYLHSGKCANKHFTLADKTKDNNYNLSSFCTICELPVKIIKKITDQDGHLVDIDDRQILNDFNKSQEIAELSLIENKEKNQYDELKKFYTKIISINPKNRTQYVEQVFNPIFYLETNENELIEYCKKIKKNIIRYGNNDYYYLNINPNPTYNTDTIFIYYKDNHYQILIPECYIELEKCKDKLEKLKNTQSGGYTKFNLYRLNKKMYNLLDYYN